MTRHSFVARSDAATTPNTPSLHGASSCPAQSARTTPPPNPSLIRAIAEVEQKLKDAEEKYKEKEKKHKEKEKKLKKELQRAERLVVKKEKKIKRLEDVLVELGRP
jgi:septal ring factor EnvC (AmiA/AmiB activator)